MAPPTASPETGSRTVTLKATTKRFFFVPQRLKPNRPTRRSSSTAMHRCLLISEILCVILECVRRFDESSGEGEHNEEPRPVGRRTLASMARTCRAFSALALDLLWMRLDSLDPLIKVLPNRIWAKKHSRFIIRMLVGDKHWQTFHKYAVRVQFLRGPCRSISPSIQHNVFAALARFSDTSSPLIPNLIELAWSESDSFSVIDPTVSLIKYFAGPRVTTLSLLLVSWPFYISVRNILADLPNLCPNVSSFTAIPRATLSDHSQDIGKIVSQWSNLRVLRTCALPQAVMDELASKKTLNTLSIELNSCITDFYVKQLPTMVHTFSLEGNNALPCIRYLQTLHGNPTRLRLDVGLDVTLPSEMETLFQMLPMHFDTIKLQHLTISLMSSFRRALALHASFPLTEPLLGHLYAFSSLVALDVDSFCASELDDAAYERMASAWPELRSLKLGAEDASRARPIASVGAVIAVLRSCPCLETLHIVFDGSIPPPPPMAVLDVDEGIRYGMTEEGSMEERVTTGRAGERSWGFSNQSITEIHVGHSPIGDDVDELADLGWCLRSVMPRLGRIHWRPLDALDVTESAGWGIVERMLIKNATDSTGLPLKSESRSAQRCAWMRCEGYTVSRCHKEG